MMADSGSRGNKEQVRQLAGMRGLMAKPQKKITGGVGEIIESPIIPNFKEGLTVLEYFISTHGARKGLADTASKTADAGYLTRRLVDVAQDVIINEIDCGTIRGLAVGALKDGEEIIEPLARPRAGPGRGGRRRATRSRARSSAKPATMIDEEIGERIEEAAKAGLEKMRIRSVLTCDCRRGVCAKCYGRNLATGRPVDLGEAVGVIAAQSIGEPGTQLTLRTFHIGGVAGRIVEQSKTEAKSEGTVRFVGLESVAYREGVWVAVGHQGELELVDDTGRIRQRFNVPYGAHLFVSDGQIVDEGAALFEWDIYNKPVVTEKSGTVRFVDVKEKVTVRDEVDDTSGLKLLVIMEDRNKELQPAIDILDSGGRKLAHYPLPTGSRLDVRDGQTVAAGDVLVKIRREEAKTRDITGGLPRVAELFEARRSKDAAIVAEIDGSVEFGGVSRGMRKIFVRAEDGDAREYQIPQGKHLYVQEGSIVRAGDRLTEGPVNPHDILKIKGIEEVRSTWSTRSRRSTACRVCGSTTSTSRSSSGRCCRRCASRIRATRRSSRAKTSTGWPCSRRTTGCVKEGQQPATFQPLLLGITKASLSTDSFISAASFQETTRVLTEAAIQGKVDYLRGLKENVIIGHLIPAGTGMQ